MRTFAAPEVWVSDQGTHFKSEIRRLLASTNGVRHHIIVAYSLWANGTVELLMRHVLSALRALTLKLPLAPVDWKCVLPLVATALHWAPLERLGRRANSIARCPIEAFTGIPPSSVGEVGLGPGFRRGSPATSAR